MTGGKCSDFVEKEKLRIVFTPHIAVASVEFQTAADPLVADVPTFAQRPIVAMKSPAPVSQHGSARFYRDQITEGIDTIL